MNNKPNGWIGVDLDGTLAFYDGWRGEDHIGYPVPAMAERVKKWLSEKRDVRIFTARVDGGEVAISMGVKEGKKFRDVKRIRRIIQDWTEKHFGARLPVTNSKDFGMIELWDDRAIQIIPNTGARVDATPRHCQTCGWWSQESINTKFEGEENLTGERLCRRSQYTSFGAYGQDGKSIITIAQFGCCEWRMKQ